MSEIHNANHLTATTNQATEKAVSKFQRVWKSRTDECLPRPTARKFVRFMSGDTRREILVDFLLVRTIGIPFDAQSRAAFLFRDLYVCENAPNLIRLLLAPERDREVWTPTVLDDEAVESSVDTVTADNAGPWDFYQEATQVLVDRFGKDLEGATIADAAAAMETVTTDLQAELAKG